MVKKVVYILVGAPPSSVLELDVDLQNTFEALQYACGTEKFCNIQSHQVRNPRDRTPESDRSRDLIPNRKKDGTLDDLDNFADASSPIGHSSGRENKSEMSQGPQGLPIAGKLL